MAYLKDELQGFVPVEQATEIMKDIARGSSLLRLSKVTEMTSDTKKIPVMVEGPGAYWVGEGERIKRTNRRSFLSSNRCSGFLWYKFSICKQHNEISREMWT